MRVAVFQTKETWRYIFVPPDYAFRDDQDVTFVGHFDLPESVRANPNIPGAGEKTDGWRHIELDKDAMMNEERRRTSQ